jgi:hypothetical protein
LDKETDLIVTKLSHAIDLLHNENAKLKEEKDHEQKLFEHRLKLLEVAKDDHETRIRSTQDGVTNFKVRSGLANTGAGMVSLLALLRAAIGG